MASLTPEKVVELHSVYGKPTVIDDVIRLRGQDEHQVPILAYPKHQDSLTEYELFTGRDVDRFVDQACWALVTDSWKPDGRPVVALYGESDLSYTITMLALLRLGCKVMTISTRLGFLAARSLLECVDCKLMIHGNTARVRRTIAEISAQIPEIVLRDMPARSDWEQGCSRDIKPFLRNKLDDDAEGKEIALIMHSSGSTGYPKPLYQCHSGVLGDLLTGMGCHAFNPLPLFHLHGLLTSLQAIYMRKTTYLWNALLPITAESLATAVAAVRPEIFHGVPYTVKLLSEHSQGVELLKCCKHVTSGGARPPDKLGDYLVNNGVNFSTTFGLTETGHIGDSMRRGPGDNDWCYLRLHSYAAPHILFVPVKEENHFEAIFLKTHPALMMSNSDDPPSSYHSGDIFIPHPTLPNAWKYVARKDDCITLENGEKINPLAMEGILRQHSLVRDALMFGIDKPLPGMLVFRAPAASALSDEEYRSAIQPAIDEANGFADSFAQIIPGMVVVIPADVEYPKTDKSNIIRAATYRLFQKQLEYSYQYIQICGDTESKPLELNVQDVEQYLLNLVKGMPGVTIENGSDDLFAAGVDSLKAIQIRGSILRELTAGVVNLPTNFVYDSGNIRNIAKRICGTVDAEHLNVSIVDGRDSCSRIDVMRGLIDKFGRFTTLARDTQRTPSEDVVVLTGATGALGAHILHQLLGRDNVRHIYCLVRGFTNARQRVLDSLADRGIDVALLGTAALEKMSALHTADLGTPNLGIADGMYHQLRSQTTLIIHTAWPVNFQIPLESFAPHVSGLRNLLDLAAAVPWKQQARVLFASSISTGFNTPRQSSGDPALIAEAQIPALSHCLNTGYAQAKLVCERICEQYAAVGGRVGVLRIGQIVGDTKKGIWNPKDFIALMVQSALVVGALPLLDGESNSCRWMPVDTMAAACLEVADSPGFTADEPETAKANVNGCDEGVSVAPLPRRHAIYYNLVAPHCYTWNDSILPLIKEAGIRFDAVPFSAWLSKLKSYQPCRTKVAEEELPILKLIDYMIPLYGDSASIPWFEVRKASHDLAAMRDCPQVVEEGLAVKFIRVWLAMWLDTTSGHHVLSPIKRQSGA